MYIDRTKEEDENGDLQGQNYRTCPLYKGTGNCAEVWGTLRGMKRRCSNYTLRHKGLQVRSRRPSFLWERSTHVSRRKVTKKKNISKDVF